MGWTYTHKDSNEPIQTFFEREFNHSSDNKSGKVLACAVKGFRTAYIAYECIAGGKRDVIAIVCLLDYKPSDYYNFGYKDMEECMGPYYYDCPQYILDMLTPTTDAASLRWREACKAKLAKKNSIKVKPGDTVKFAQPIRFTNGAEIQTFQFMKGSKFAPKTGFGLMVYKISHWKERDFQVLTQ